MVDLPAPERRVSRVATGLWFVSAARCSFAIRQRMLKNIFWRLEERKFHASTNRHVYDLQIQTNAARPMTTKLDSSDRG